jgi:hypothetical protein
MFALACTGVYVLFVVLVCLLGDRWAQVNRYPVSPIARVDQDEQLDITPAMHDVDVAPALRRSR